MPSVPDIPIGEAPDQLVPDKVVCREFGVTPMTIYRWDRSLKLAAMGWEPPVKINDRNYRWRSRLERFKANLRDFGLRALKSPRPGEIANNKRNQKLAERAETNDVAQEARTEAKAAPPHTNAVAAGGREKESV
jgi:hypothetical protein